MAIFEIKHLTFSYPEAEKRALSDITLSVKEGEFVVLCGASGCGKSTLLRHFKTVLTPHGDRTGERLFKGDPLDAVSERRQSGEIGYVLQNPDNQIVTDKVWHELAFGLESLGYDNATIRLRVAEMASYFGIQDWFKKNVTELSGGQKQLLNLASIMALQPDLLILDEPTSQLDPIAASDFLGTIKKINRDLGTTVILSEHRFEEVLPGADRAVVMDGGRIVAADTPRRVGDELEAMGHDMFVAMPAPMQIVAGVGKNQATEPSARKDDSPFPWPITVREGRRWLDQWLSGRKVDHRALPERTASEQQTEDKAPVVTMKEVWFKYDRTLPDVIRGLTLNIVPGEMFCIVGGNGTGKSTTLKLISGLVRPYRGKIKIMGKPVKGFDRETLYQQILGVMPQNPQSLFIKKNVELDLYEMLEEKKIPIEEKDDRVDEVIALTHLEDLLARHPYDLSGGEQQRLALAKILLMKPQVLILDEPTKGLDNHYKLELGEILKHLQKEQGVTIIMVSHDVEFCARFADRCGLFFDGNLVTTGSPRAFFSGNSFYTTSANRMSRHCFENAVTAEDVIALCKMNTQQK
ncbi:MAG: energy-coupling factor transporter ATPase [Eubacteriaceae bacterium]|nr:energy-coupling factor transporter ATPase [Eubacteriaceae bacterium]MDD4508407.1 energy-coupling factor transporter ATPase [Eubacteriaceae bacterium]